MRILSKLILARERQPLAQSTWAVTSPSPRKRPHLKLPNTLRYDDVLPALVNGYNRSQHRSIGMASQEVTSDNEDTV